ncbi:MAG TPA: 2-amino-4-hydroxy-6-hydroxymethyldihydropteridine diphosphokinase [Xanthobacteraceae bacterium]|nr:2-amino-4-hydroxy-6-hydroxymethyldihydropteridine diphosphokinase [Xanthobacteraceae bacterium]
MAEALLGFGGNIGDVRTTLARAIDAYCDGIAVRLTARSSDYRTPPWGDEDQPPFVNLCIAVEAEMPPHALLQRARAVEARFGRDREREQRWGPRPLDIDILVYDNVVSDDADLTLPHPRLLERAFVLVPLAEIRPQLTVGGIGIQEALAKLDVTRIERLPVLA